MQTKHCIQLCEIIKNLGTVKMKNDTTLVKLVGEGGDTWADKVHRPPLLKFYELSYKRLLRQHITIFIKKVSLTRIHLF